jgi:hypothetical protein
LQTTIYTIEAKLVCSDCQEATDLMASVIKSAKVDREAGLEFIEGIREGLEDFADGRYKIFKDADELLAYLLSP